MTITNKYNMPPKQSVLWALKKLADNLWRSAKLEGLDITFQQIETLRWGEVSNTA